MSVYFYNEEAIDLRVISLMGVNVKPNANAIGYFGTGLKFAIATILRLGHTFELIRDGVHHPIGLSEEIIRGESFQVVSLDDKMLSITTELGKNWVEWQAYRELHSNCLDERGTISDKELPGNWGTVIRVTGDAFQEAYEKRGEIFLETTPIAVNDLCEIHEGRSGFGFYRTIRAYDLPKPALFTYNVKRELMLTEDRSISSAYEFNTQVTNTVLRLVDKSLIEQLLLAPDGMYEQDLNFLGSSIEPSAAFLEVCAEHRSNAGLNQSAYARWKKNTPPAARAIKPAPLSPFSHSELHEALELLPTLGCPLTLNDFIVVDDLGTGVYGMMRDDQIFIDKKTLDRGVRFIAGTLYEEWVHKTHNLRDESRDLQNFLLDKLMLFAAMAKKSGYQAPRMPTAISALELFESDMDPNAILKISDLTA